jgi:hypothetical protein
MLLLLLALAIVPVLAYRYAQRHHPDHVFAVTGSALGSIVSPFSLGLYATFFIPYIGFAPGMLGLAAATFHGAPAHALALHFGIIPPQVVEGVSHFYLAAIDAIIWAPAYGGFGWLIDRSRSQRLRSNDG